MHVVLLGDKSDLLDAVAQHFRQLGGITSILEHKNIAPNDQEIKTKLAVLEQEKGTIDGFFHMANHRDIDGMLPFLFAKHLSRYYHRSDHPSRKTFMIAISLDGAFGLHQPENSVPEKGALTGLVKSLHQEWPWVYTKIVDLSPTLKPEFAAESILNEWMDADGRWVEVGITEQSRSTIDFTMMEE